MKKLLMATVAASALTLAGAAFAQGAGGAPEKNPAGAEKSTHEKGAEHGSSAAAPGHAPAGERGHSAAAPGHEPAGEHGRSAESPGHVSGTASEGAHTKAGAERKSETSGTKASERGAAAESHGAAGAAASGKASSEKSGSAEERRGETKGASAGKAEHGKTEQGKAEEGKAGHRANERTGASESSQKGAAGEAGKSSGHGAAATNGGSAGKSSAETNGGAAGKASSEKAGAAGMNSKTGAAESGKTGEKNAAGEQKGTAGSSAQGTSATGTEAHGGRAGEETNTNVSVSGKVNLEPQKAERVHQELIQSAGTESRTDVDINVNVGGELPERVHPRPLPSTIVEIAPQFRGYDYVVVRDEIVIVQPRTRKVVEVIRGRGHGGEHGERGAHRTTISLDKHQREVIRRDVMKQKVETRHVDVREGMEVPQTVTLEPLPEDIYSVVPEVREYRYFVTDNDRIVLVDPDSREVVDVLQ